MQQQKTDGRNRLFILMSFCGFIVYAFYFNTFGTNAPVMMEFYRITSAQQGFILTMQSVGGVAAAIFLALNGEKYNKIHVIAFGLLMLCIGCVLIGLAPAYGWLIALVVLSGVGFTFIDVMTNGVISEVYPQRKSTLLPVTHAFYGAGSMLAPLFVTAVVNPEIISSFRFPFLIIGIATAVVCTVYFLAGQSIMKQTPYAHMDEMKKRASENPAEIFKTTTAWVFLIAGILYFTFQIGIASWLPTYCIESAGIGFETAGVLLTAFFGGALVMRFSGALILKKISPKALFSVFGIIAALLMAGALFVTENVALMTALIVASGFMQGSNVVTLVIMCCETFPKRTASASAIVVIAVNAASLTAPLWMGAMAEKTGFRIPLLIGCACLAIAAVMIIALGKKLRAQKEC